MSSHANQQGFTIVELLLATSIAAILVTVLMTISLTYYGSTLNNHISAQLGIDSHYVLRNIVEDIRIADSVGTTNVLTDSNQPNGGWITSDPNNVLVITNPATNTTRDVIYDSSTGYPYRNELIYFISGNTLYKRTLQNIAAVGNIAKTSCPPTQATSSCPADKTYTTYIDDFTFTFYDNNNVATADPSLARSVKVGVTMSRKSFGKTVTFTNSIQATLRNK
jgi:prepilin-type N-terminal cleavage/methylation domain-containing protein